MRTPFKQTMHPVALVRIPPSVVSFAVDRLAEVDYSVANRVTEGVATAVHFVYDHHLPLTLVPPMLHLLQTFDDLGSWLIALVIWLGDHAI